ncbi:CD63 antigen [Contarinia nasturtii]|uniref:CD63 antigen n=1 Tax=Contarinia nasturtii TaxID=265458 RepID=UPI0012D3B041|nr:CD63 antigen [Contarinia nasturtii]
MKSCGMGIIKYILFAFNFIFAVSGLGILIAGILVLIDINDFKHFLEGNIQAPPITLIVLGSLIFFIAFLGCYGAIRESPTLLIWFAVLLGIVFLIELGVGIAACLFKADLEEFLQKSLKNSIERSNSNDLDAWDTVQKKLECCGITGYDDWVEISKNRVIRSSCCRKDHIDNQTNDCSNRPATYPDKYYTDGCLTKLKHRIGNNASTLITVGIGVAFIQLIGIVLACYLAASIRRESVN